MEGCIYLLQWRRSTFKIPNNFQKRLEKQKKNYYFYKNPVFDKISYGFWYKS